MRYWRPSCLESAPLAEFLVGQVSPIVLAELLYLGRDIGLSITRLDRDWVWKPNSPLCLPGLSFEKMQSDPWCWA